MLKDNITINITAKIFNVEYVYIIFLYVYVYIYVYVFLYFCICIYEYIYIYIYINYIFKFIKTWLYIHLADIRHTWLSSRHCKILFRALCIFKFSFLCGLHGKITFPAGVITFLFYIKDLTRRMQIEELMF